MDRPHVVVCMLPSDSMSLLQATCTVTERALEEPLVPDALDSAVAIVTTPYDSIDATFLARVPDLRIVAQFGVGTDNIDLAAAQSNGVAVTHTPGAVTESTADFTMALLLAVARRLPEAAQLLDEGPQAQPLGMELSGKTMGIIGLGRIGRAVARRAQGFGMRIVYCNRRQANPTVERETAAIRLPLAELLACSDVISLHCDLNTDSYQLINAGALLRMKPSAILINTARAQVVDEAALAEAISRGALAGAGLDVFARPVSTALQESPRIVMAPHAGTATVGARRKMGFMVAESILACVSSTAEIPHRLV